ncbi:hypothetical protein [Marinobacter sp. VGCF2001]|uniref:hypothetical protein n=1 Tax=Marinobacter sp. VGCF2001 TaxID=3417189 RepID=UPI003CE7DA2C
MKFLCPRHRTMFARLSLSEKNDLWLLWMEHAMTFNERQDSNKLIAITGSAFDLACMARRHDPDAMQVELTLAAILVGRALRDTGDIASADRVLFRALDSLGTTDAVLSSPSGRCNTDECLQVLLDVRRQPEFITRYLNWPCGAEHHVPRSFRQPSVAMH